MAAPFLGPWELFEVLDEEFHQIHGTPRGEPVDWRVEADDVLDPLAVQARVRELVLDPGKAALVATLNSALLLPPPVLVQRTGQYVKRSFDRKLRERTWSEVPGTERLRFNREVLNRAMRLTGTSALVQERELEDPDRIRTRLTQLRLGAEPPGGSAGLVASLLNDVIVSPPALVLYRARRRLRRAEAAALRAQLPARGDQEASFAFNRALLQGMLGPSLAPSDDWFVHHHQVIDPLAVREAVVETGLWASRTELARVLSALLPRHPDEVVALCQRYLETDRGRTFRKSRAVRAALAEPERLRFNRQVLDEAFSGILRPGAERELERLFRRVDGKRETEARWALCLSGGGIRSASFALGVIQGLGRESSGSGERMLGRFDYLSTVSGGGYIGSWLSAWMAREGRDPVLESLAGSPRSAPLGAEAAPIQYLRSYTNFLSPRKGAASPDMWTLWATVLRNLLLTWIVIVPVVATALTIPLLLAAFAADPPGTGEPARSIARAVCGVVAAIGLVVAVWFVHSRRPDPESAAVPGFAPTAGHSRSRSVARWKDQRAFLQYFLFPLCLSAVALFLAWMWSVGPHVSSPDENRWPSPGVLVAILAIAGAVAHVAGWGAALWTTHSRFRRSEFAGVLFTGSMAGVLTALASELVHGVSDRAARWAAADHATKLEYAFNLAGPAGSAASREDALVLAATVLTVPSILLAVTLGGFLFVGISSHRQHDEEREWSARESGWVLLVVAGWLLVGTVVLASGPILNEGYRLVVAALAGGAGWGAASLGKSAKTRAEGSGGRASGGLRGKMVSLVQEHALAVAAPVAVVLIIVAIAGLNLTLLEAVNALTAHRTDWRTPAFDLWGTGWRVPAFTLVDWPDTTLGQALVVGAALLLAGMLTSWLVDVNKFSLHAMYRARLIRAYLGASRPPGRRQPDPFTGFDPHDNVAMQDLRDAAPPPDAPGAKSGRRAPIHVLNLALNLVAGKNLAWQDRKARCFTVTPFYAGAYGLGYRRTSLDRLDPAMTADAYYAGARGISLGTAMAISGAAASPNMGYYSSPAVTFLMTMFNARLGWWLGNPGWVGSKTMTGSQLVGVPKGAYFHASNPRSVVPPIFRELLGLTTDSEALVYLSDGGHFENLGIYEMVLRRCRVIVVVDASCDEQCNLADLGNAVRKVRVDLGVPIEFDRTFEIQPRGADGAFPPDGQRIAVATIRYDVVDEDAVNGKIFYLKPTMTGREPRDIFAYARASAPFPHESTIDQFFSEMQFESYRALGQFSGAELSGEIRRSLATQNRRA